MRLKDDGKEKRVYWKISLEQRPARMYNGNTATFVLTFRTTFPSSNQFSQPDTYVPTDLRGLIFIS